MIHARPEKKKEILQAITDLNNQVMTNEGCVKSSLYQDLDNLDSFYIIDEWKSLEDLENYKNSRELAVLHGLNSMLSEVLVVKHASKL